MMERGTSWKSSSGEILLCPACPRCGSGNTKFCYYNNYSLTQPRYFCKGCRRYWTKGGSLRNVPVGGGCRKSRRAKSTSSIRVSTHNNNSSSSSISTPPDNNNNKYASNSTSTGIDIAAVYANFLSQPPRPPENQLIRHETSLHANHQLPAASDGVLHIPIEFPNFQGLHMNDIYHGFFDSAGCRLNNMSEPPAALFYGGGGVEALNIHHKPTGTTSGSFSINNNNNNNGTILEENINGGILSSLPPLPGEDVAEVAMASSEGMLWPPMDQRMSGSAVGGDQMTMINSELMLTGNVSPSFSAFNLESIFRS